jgi:sec-independent protein translocase protein TatA
VYSRAFQLPPTCGPFAAKSINLVLIMSTFPLYIAGVLGLGGPEMIVIFAVLLLLFGGSKLPELAKGLGKSIKEFKHASREDAEPEPSPTERTPPAPVKSVERST